MREATLKKFKIAYADFSAGTPLSQACKRAGISPNTYTLALKEAVIPEVEEPAFKPHDTSGLPMRLWKSDLMTEDKIFLLDMFLS